MPGSSPYEIRRFASSLSIENFCTACNSTFSAPHLLARHQKSSCPRMNERLAGLRKLAQEVERSRKGPSTDGLNSAPDCPPEPDRHTAEQDPGASDLLNSISAEYSHTQGGGCAGAPLSEYDSRPASDVSHPHSLTSSGLHHPSGGQRARLDYQSPRGPSRPLDTTPTNQSACDASRASPPCTPERELYSLTNAVPSYLTAFGLSKRYMDGQEPAADPDAIVTPLDLYDCFSHRDEEGLDEQADPAGGHGVASQERLADGQDLREGAGVDSTNQAGEGLKKEATQEAKHPDAELLAPFPNLSSFEIGEWFYGQGNQKSLKDFKALISILTSPRFCLEDILETKWTGVFQKLGKNKEDISTEDAQWAEDSGWKTTDVKIDVPVHKLMPLGDGVETHIIGTLHHRSIVAIVEEKIRNAPESQYLHLDGHELYWKPDESSDSPGFRVLSELYNSDAFLETQRQLRDNPPPSIKDCTLPKVVVGLQFWSDATHLSTFSSSKLWPVYMVIGNESKHRRGNGTWEGCHHVAYFDSDRRKNPPHLITYLNRECFHEQWVILLDDELLKAIIEGIVIRCSDGIERRFFIRIFTYSSDYPERCLIASIKNGGDCPCVRCLVRKKNLDQMGTAEDMLFRKTHPRVDSGERQIRVWKARAAIYGGGAVSGDPIQRILPFSDVPTINAFADRLRAKTGFDVYSMLVVDILHEYEIGVFKGLFLHLIRILEASASGSVLVHLLDKRYRSVPTFNQTIRKFSLNVSELKRRAARDYENILQVAIPAFHGLLPEPLGKSVTKLLYINARWHALAKLRMHTDATMLLLEVATSQLGDEFRAFAQISSTINTVETPWEAEKRNRAAIKQQSAKQNPSHGSRRLPTASDGRTTTFRLPRSTLQDQDIEMADPSTDDPLNFRVIPAPTNEMAVATSSPPDPGASLPPQASASGSEMASSAPGVSPLETESATPGSSRGRGNGGPSQNKSEGTGPKHTTVATHTALPSREEQSSHRSIAKRKTEIHWQFSILH
ncbi:hypothetical protein NMY22_g14642 [Coprinellus aureogranulatus]|nr:hypothetical protein NMY22_g14642 [Coprinellus aureogranulatus]